jgi:hypothetical protein
MSSNRRSMASNFLLRKSTRSVYWSLVMEAGRGDQDRESTGHPRVATIVGWDDNTMRPTGADTEARLRDGSIEGEALWEEFAEGW